MSAGERTHRPLAPWGIALLTAATNGSGLLMSAIYGRLGLVQVAYVAAILLGLVGAVVMSRQPQNRLGRLFAGFSLLTGLSVVPFVYGAPAYLSHAGSWPGGQFALWIDAWMWIVPFGIGMPLILAAFPDGNVPSRWRFIPPLAAAGVVLLVASVALTPGPMYPFGFAPNPFGLSGAQPGLAALAGLGLFLVVAADVSAAVSVGVRYRRARGDERQQIKWIALAGGLLGACVLYAAAAFLLFHQSLPQSLLPFSIAVLAGPLAFGVAILRYRLYDIDLIINRALVYGALTAILAGVYAGGVTLLQRLYIFITGQKSDAALVITAFAIAVLFSPVRDRLQKLVDRRLGGRDPVQALDALTADVESVVRVMDVHRALKRLVDLSVDGYQARFGAVYLNPHDRHAPVYSRGRIDQEPAVEIEIKSGEKEMGRLLLGPRRGGHDYSRRDRDAIQASADAIADAVTLARELGHASSQRDHGASARMRA